MKRLCRNFLIRGGYYLYQSFFSLQKSALSPPVRRTILKISIDYFSNGVNRLVLCSGDGILLNENGKLRTIVLLQMII